MTKHLQITPTKPASLADVAAMAGVSTGTVSRTLSRPEMISKETRDRVMQAVGKLGYVVNGAARALAMRRSNTIGAVILKFGSSNFAQVVEGLESEVASKGYTLLLSAPVPDGKTELAALAAMLARGVDAIALLGFEGNQAAKEILARYPIPYAHLWANPKGGTHCIGLDEARNGAIALHHLADLGHRHIGHIWGSTKGPARFRSRSRLQGVLSAAKQRGVTIEKQACVQTEHGFEQGLIAAETIVQTRHPATALICASDYLALGALRGLVKHGVKVPQDMSIISFNDNDFAAFTVPSLSTVRLPIREVGCKAGHYLLDCLGEPLGEDEYLLEPTLKARESSAPVRARTL